MTRKKTVLIADDDKMLLQALRRRCEALSLNVRTVTDGLDAMVQISEAPPDLIILDIKMPAADGLSVCEKLATKEGVDLIPTIFLTGVSDEETIGRCEALGAYYVFKDADAWDNLKPVICDILEIKSEKAPVSRGVSAASEKVGVGPTAPTLLAIDDDPDILRALKVRLEAAGANFLEASNPQAGFSKALEEKPDVIITDYLMPEASGLYLIQRLRNCRITKDIPVIVVTGQTLDGDTEDIALMRRMCSQEGVVAYLQKPVAFEKLYNVLTKTLRLPLKDLAPSLLENTHRQPASTPRRQAFGRRGR